MMEPPTWRDRPRNCALLRFTVAVASLFCVS